MSLSCSISGATEAVQGQGSTKRGSRVNCFMGDGNLGQVSWLNPSTRSCSLTSLQVTIFRVSKAVESVTLLRQLQSLFLGMAECESNGICVQTLQWSRSKCENVLVAVEMVHARIAAWT